MTQAPRIALRAGAITFRGNPFLAPEAETFVYESDALLVMEAGRITAFGPYEALWPSLAEGTEIRSFPDALLCPGFIDTHVHYPQTGMIASFAGELLEWLERYTFPTELAFADPAYADAMAKVFLRQLLRNGTTTAMVYCTVHPHSAEALFAESHRFDTRMIAGKVLMDRNAPEGLLDESVARSIAESEALIARWHGTGRQLYAVTPRFAGTSTPEQLEAAGHLLKRQAGLFLQTHLSENRKEIEWIAGLFPERADYLDVYAHAGLVGPRAVFGHGVHVSEGNLCTCHETGAALAHCPTSNLFLGSGLFRLFDALDPRRPVRVGLGTDVGAGTSFSQLASLNEAYKVAALQGGRLDAVKGFYLATLGGAHALHLDDRLGRLAPGYEADVCVLDLKATELLALRTARSDDISDQLFALMTLGDDRAIRATYVAGRCAYDRDRAEPFQYA
ncbi:putative guanine aminohydrolase [Azorhizobium caulinodans ORS 571]|uniref:Guanine deaminase n=1 Tax=Azorhizobium caulinodans (strain ATCC 43989 / DSM 5975 / JCM 20966 / LMG 6465 / NBRC 14845 / NCIMB 13405 / ORS 571) TaxID=438753 RepID=A8HZT7_AZOC5|nr:guanine deaminase [Azorhizobium caulinodans]BAF90623.1 putative guanine aminohydrolase [Azorhizobium caulinodans ORS 571]